MASCATAPAAALSPSPRAVQAVLTLTGVNTYTGITTLSAGTVQIFAESGLGSNPGAFSASQLTLNGGTLQTSGTFAIDDSNRGITVGASGGTFSTDALTTLTLSNPIAGAGAGPLTKLGAGTLVLGSTNTWTAATPATALTINAGTVQFSTDANLGNAANRITLGRGAIEFTGGTTVSGRTVNIPTTGGTILANGTGGARIHPHDGRRHFGRDGRWLRQWKYCRPSGGFWNRW